jgi:PAS domain S-box-containing protein
MPKPDAAAVLRALDQASDDAIVVVDSDGIVFHWNYAAERLYGYKAEEIIGQPYLVLVPPQYLAEHDESTARVYAGEPAHWLETFRIRRDGTRILISQNLSLTQSPDGSAGAIVRVEHGQGVRSGAERAARRLAALVESSEDAIVSKDLNGIVTSWNPAATRMFGYSAEEMIGESIRKIIPNDRQDEEDTVLARIRSGHRVDDFETIMQDKYGRAFEIALTVSPIRDDEGRVVGASKIARDISESVRLRQMAERQVAIVNRLSRIGATVASTLKRETIVQTVTDAAAELTEAEFGAFCYNPAEMPVGRAFSPYTLPGTSRDAFSAFLQAGASPMFGPTFNGNDPLRIDDVTADPRFRDDPRFNPGTTGRLLIRSYLAVPVKSVRGEVLAGLFFGHSQAAFFTKEHEELAGGIATWASVALQNARLYVEAQEANRIKDEFLAVLSHELRTPLNSIMGYARLLRGGILSGDKAQRGLETLERNVTLLTQIVEDVLDVSRIVAGKIRLDVQAVDLPVVVHEAIATIVPAADAKGVRIQATIDPRVGPISGDPDRLQQVVWNLLTNAVKFTPRHGRVQVRLASVNSHVEIVVSDTGIGIPPEFLPHVFERFRQADSTTTRKVGGLGLGLSIVRHIAEMHGGTVQASSPGEGQGATFRVSLPLMIVHPQAFEGAREHPRRELLEPLTELVDLSGVRVMAIDDEADALTLLKVVLESAGAEVMVMPSAVEALAQIDRLRPHARVVDLGMPVMDGFEFIRRIRESPNLDVRRIPAAALTAFARSEDRTKALRGGFEMHLAKPVDPGELVASVATLVRRAGHD